MRRALIGAGIAALVVVVSYAVFVECAHQQTERPRWAIARSPFGGITGCAPNDDAERICRWARDLAPVINNDAERDRLANELRASMCNPPVIGMFGAVGAAPLSEKARMLRAGVTEVGGALECPELERIWPPATAAPSPRAP